MSCVEGNGFSASYAAFLNQSAPSMSTVLYIIKTRKSFLWTAKTNDIFQDIRAKRKLGSKKMKHKTSRREIIYLLNWLNDESI